MALQQSLEQHRAKVEDIEKALQERRNHLEQLHRQAADEASHGAEATQLEIMFPDGITKHLPQEAKDSLKRAADLYEEEHKAEAAAKEAAARPTKEAMELDEFGNLDDQEDSTPDRTNEARIQASIDELLQAQTRGDPERLAVLRAQMARDPSSPVSKKKPKQGKRWPQAGSRDLHRDNQWELLDHTLRVDGASGAATCGAGTATSAGGWQM